MTLHSFSSFRLHKADLGQHDSPEDHKVTRAVRKVLQTLKPFAQNQLLSRTQKYVWWKALLKHQNPQTLEEWTQALKILKLALSFKSNGGDALAQKCLQKWMRANEEKKSSLPVSLQTLQVVHIVPHCQGCIWSKTQRNFFAKRRLTETDTVYCANKNHYFGVYLLNNGQCLLFRTDPDQVSCLLQM